MKWCDKKHISHYYEIENQYPVHQYDYLPQGIYKTHREPFSRKLLNKRDQNQSDPVQNKLNAILSDAMPIAVIQSSVVLIASYTLLSVL